jgi:hypothetical protein
MIVALRKRYTDWGPKKLERYLLREHPEKNCEPLEGERIEASKHVFESVFREHGMPLRMRSDNGVPFASTAIGGLSRLSVWWIKLGILPERIEPGHPEQNGRHERMHRTLKAAVASPPASDWEAQRLMLQAWKKDFNEVRPHEALQMNTPGMLHQPSPRLFPDHVGDPDYPERFDIRRVKTSGTISIENKEVTLGSVLGRECVGLEPVQDGLWHLWFGPIFLGRLQALGRKSFHLEKSRPIKTT